MRESATPLVGIIANPVSARDIRRVIANANSLQLADRVNIVLRLLSSLASCGVSFIPLRVIATIGMEEKAGENKFCAIS